MISWLVKFLLMAVFVVCSHAMDYGLKTYGERAVNKYLLSDENPSRRLYSSEGVLLMDRVDSAGRQAMIQAAEHVTRLEGKINAYRVAQQVLLCVIFGFFLRHRRESLNV